MSLIRMEITRDVKNLIEAVNRRVNAEPPSAPVAKLSLPSKDMSIGELGELLSVLAKEYNTTLPVLIRKLDRVSGDVRALDRIYTQNDTKAEWDADEDKLLSTNPALIIRWKGEEACDMRKKYLASKVK